MTGLQSTTRTHAHGFSLLELLVVISIIAVISSLLFVGVSVLQEGAKESQARSILANLLGNAGMYETKTTKPIGHYQDSLIRWGGTGWARNAPGRESETGRITPDYYDNPDKVDNHNYTYGEDNDFYMEQSNLYIERFIWAAHQMPQIRENLPSLGESFGDFDGDGFMEVNDPWGNPIAYANNVSHRDSVTQDDFLPVYDKSFFASAGQDQLWGVHRNRGEFSTEAAWETYQATDDYKHSVDNLYSFDLDRSAALR